MATEDQLRAQLRELTTQDTPSLDEALTTLASMQKSLTELAKSSGGGESLESLKKEIRKAKESF